MSNKKGIDYDQIERIMKMYLSLSEEKKELAIKEAERILKET